METIGNEGLTLNQYCEMNEISPSSVWQKIRQGELVSRTIGGRLKIFGNESVSTVSPRVFGATAKDSSANFLPDLPNVSPIRQGIETEANSLAVQPSSISIYEQSDNSDLALLIDHLSLAKEENKEILRMTQDSIRKITEMSEQLLESKEQVVDAHKQTIQEKNLIIEVQQEKIEGLRRKLKNNRSTSEEKNRVDFDFQLSKQQEMYDKMLTEKELRIESLSEKISSMQVEMLKLRQEYEDLEILARTLAKDS